MFDHFNFLAPIYDRVIQPKPPEKIAQLLDFQSDQVLLDIGGGTGRISQFFVHQEKRVLIADTSHKMLEKAQDKPGLILVNAPSELLPFANDYFDRILMVDALHHVLNQKKTASELWRVIKPGGRILIEEPDIKRFAVKLVAVAEKITLMRSHFLSANQIKDLFKPFTTQIRIEKEDHYVWVIVEKGKPQEDLPGLKLRIVFLVI